MKTIISLKDADYELDLEKALEVGLLKKCRPVITEISNGDFFVGFEPTALVRYMPILIVIGYKNNVVMMDETFQAYHLGPFTRQEAIDLLNKRGMVFKTNIKERFSASIKGYFES